MKQEEGSGMKQEEISGLKQKYAKPELEITKFKAEEILCVGMNPSSADIGPDY
jgi:hypothetical protein